MNEGTVGMNHKTPGNLLDEAYERGIAEGERRERARVVAYLQSVDRLVWASAPLLASRIEHGEHTKEGA